MKRILVREKISPRVTGCFKDVCSGDNYLLVGDIGYDPPHGPGPGGVSSQSINTYHRNTTKSECRWELGIPAAGYDNAGGGVRGDGRVHYEEAEYSHTIHCNTTNSGPTRGDGADARGVGS